MEIEYILEVYFDDEISPAWTEIMDNVSIDRAKEIIKQLTDEDSAMVDYKFYETKEIDLF
tara:strand:+ start:25330 stop:25509 length:180 start_codon:yes stop_codon:yes gene_type:complete